MKHFLLGLMMKLGNSFIRVITRINIIKDIKNAKNRDQFQRFIDIVAEYILFSKKVFIFNFWAN